MPQQGGEEEGGGHRLVLGHALVGVLQGEGDEALAAGLFQDGVEQGQQAVVQALGPQLVHAAQGVAGKQQLEHLVEQAGTGHVLQQGPQLGHRGAGGGVDVEVEAGGEAHRPQHPHRVFAEALFRLADDAQALVLDVVHAAVVVPHLFGGRVVVQGVDGEVPPHRVFLQGAEHVVAHDAAGFVLVAVAALVGGGAAEGGDFDGFRPAHDVDDLEAAADDAGAAEQGAHLVRLGVGGDVEILGLPAQHQVPHRAAHHVGLVAGVLQGVGDLEGAGRNAVTGDAVGLDRDGAGFLAEFRRLQDAPDQFGDHAGKWGWWNGFAA